jgi:rubrerythrin
MIEDEKAAANKYQLALDEADSDELKAILEKLLHEEQFHVDFLEQEIRRLQSA